MRNSSGGPAHHRHSNIRNRSLLARVSVKTNDRTLNCGQSVAQSIVTHNQPRRHGARCDNRTNQNDPSAAH